MLFEIGNDVLGGNPRQTIANECLAFLNFLIFFLSKCYSTYFLFKLHNKKDGGRDKNCPILFKSNNQILLHLVLMYILCTRKKPREFTFRCQLGLTMTQKLTVIVLSFLILGIKSCTLFHGKFYQEFTDEGLSDDSNINVQRIR